MSAAKRLLVIALLVAAAASAAAPESNFTLRMRLLEVLEARKGSYEIGIRPDLENLNVSLRLLIGCVYGLTNNELMEFSGWLELVWMDPRYQWSPDEWGNITTLEMGTKNVWLPDVSFWDAKEPKNGDIRSRTIRTVRLRPSGQMSIFLRILVSIPCPIDSLLFPFDQQVCRITIGSANSPRSYYHLLLTNVTLAGVKKSPVGEWHPVAFSSNVTTVLSGDTYYDSYEVTLVLDRKPLYHVVLVVIPFVLLTVIALVMFLAKEAGDRVSISIAILLAMTLYVMITSQNAPKSMERIPLLGVYLMIQMSLLIGFTFLAVMSAIAPDMATPVDALQTLCGGLGLEVNNNDVTTGTNTRRRKSMWGVIQTYGSKLDTLYFIMYLLMTVINSTVCLLILPYALVSHEHEHGAQRLS